MRQSIFTITAILIICATAAAQPDTLWTRTFGGINDDYGYSVQQTSDGGYIMWSWRLCGVRPGIVLKKDIHRPNRST